MYKDYKEINLQIQHLRKKIYVYIIEYAKQSM